ncbi:MAG TPA: hypothetical protein VFQ91_22480 [Bryobacteraceae bacterium]|nr:hypothetical protein [Bryobacteraceae bacterium]
MASPGMRKREATDVSEEEWGFAAPYLTLMEKEARQRIYSLWEAFHGLAVARQNAECRRG